MKARQSSDETRFCHQRWIQRGNIHEHPFQRNFLQSIGELRRYWCGYLFWYCTGCSHICDISGIWEKKMNNSNDLIRHYDALIDEGNDPVFDPPPLREYMDKWDGQAFIDAMELDEKNPCWKSAWEPGGWRCGQHLCAVISVVSTCLLKPWNGRGKTLRGSRTCASSVGISLNIRSVKSSTSYTPR